MTEFTPLTSAIGGMLIGLSAVFLMVTHGRIAGMTGIFNAVLPPFPADWHWRVSFLAGAVLAPAIYVLLSGNQIEVDVPVSHMLLAAGGVIVGIGVTFGSGCTSGHGVCGMARFSRRSFVATCVFMAATFASVFIVRHVIGL